MFPYHTYKETTGKITGNFKTFDRDFIAELAGKNLEEITFFGCRLIITSSEINYFRDGMIRGSFSFEVLSSLSAFFIKRMNQRGDLELFLSELKWDKSHHNLFEDKVALPKQEKKRNKKENKAKKINKRKFYFND